MAERPFGGEAAGDGSEITGQAFVLGRSETTTRAYEVSATA